MIACIYTAWLTFPDRMDGWIVEGFEGNKYGKYKDYGFFWLEEPTC